jgi:hypothetical protein
MWCDVMWCDLMWCDVMWCDVMWCDVMWCDVMWHYAMSCCTTWYLNEICVTLFLSIYLDFSCPRTSFKFFDRPTLNPIWNSLHALIDCIGLLPNYDQVGRTALRQATDMFTYQPIIPFDNSVMKLIILVLLNRGARTDSVDMVRYAVRWNDVVSIKASKLACRSIDDKDAKEYFNHDKL